MRIHYSNTPFKIDVHSIFLVGPTPRDKKVPSWRPRALEILKDMKYEGGVYVPEWDTFAPRVDYDAQVEWELAGLDICRAIAAWVPRELEKMPAFTTNVEFGRYVDSKRLFYGRPDGAPSTRYLDHLYRKVTRRDPKASLEELLGECVQRVNNWQELPE